MRIVAWIFRVVLFLAALGFALSNTGITELRFFGVDVVWRAPLVIFLLVFYAGGMYEPQALKRKRGTLLLPTTKNRLSAWEETQAAAPAVTDETPAATGAVSESPANDEEARRAA